MNIIFSSQWVLPQITPDTVESCTFASHLFFPQLLECWLIQVGFLLLVGCHVTPMSYHILGSTHLLILKSAAQYSKCEQSQPWLEFLDCSQGCSPAQPSTAHPITAQHSTTQHSTTLSVKGMHLVYFPNNQAACGGCVLSYQTAPRTAANLCV